MTIVWTACGGSTQWWSRYLLGTLYGLGDARSPLLALRLQFPVPAPVETTSGTWGERMRTMDVNCSSPKKYPRLSRLEAPPKVAQQSASTLDQVIHGNGGGMRLERGPV